MSTYFNKILTDEIPSEFKFVNEKLIIDFLNGIGVSKDLQGVVKKRSSHKNRFFDAISGKAYLKQANLNDHILTGLHACESWLNSVSFNISEHSVAISQISNTLSKTQSHLQRMAHVVIDVREQLDSLVEHTAELISDVDALKKNDAAKTNLDLVFSSWGAGDFNRYSIIGKLYIALDNLYWGSFSKILGSSDKDKFLKILRNNLVIQLKNEFNTNKEDQIFLRSEWISNDSADKGDQELLEYMGDWSLLKPKVVPNVFLATQWDTLDKSELEKPEIAHLPFHVADIQTVADSLINEFFEVRKNV
ncbi:diguanylate cyclase regulator RdcB family protein [Acinetobacter bereziniae]|uniref:diguanylate cyclase regulator RdcB family protein n=1 Tax=Acinetobacter bereziniae TaxID=106648 RepID=UPI00300A5629